MKCPECGCKKSRRKGIITNKCKRCGCEWIVYSGCKDIEIVSHGNFKNPLGIGGEKKMACPECSSKKVVNENTGRDPMLKRIGGTFHNTCKNCGCVWTYCCATGSNIIRHGKFKRGKRSDNIF